MVLFKVLLAALLAASSATALVPLTRPGRLLKPGFATTTRGRALVVRRLVENEGGDEQTVTDLSLEEMQDLFDEADKADGVRSEPLRWLTATLH